jgi:fructosamine-3-kinase
MYSIFGVYPKSNKAELHVSGLIGTASQTDMWKSRVTGFFFENRLQWQFEVEKNFFKLLV